MEEKKNGSKKIIIALAALIVVAAALLAVFFATKSSTSAGEKKITVEVVHKDATVKSFPLTTSAEYLGEALKEAELVEGEDGEYGLYITSVDGEAADEGNQEWWCLTKDGAQVNTSADSTPIADGEKYELTLTVGYDVES